MKSRQVGLVLAALIVIGIAGLVIRLISAEPEEEVLAGLLPITQDVVTRITVYDNATDQGADLVKIGDEWTVNNLPVFPLMMNQFWRVVAEVDGAQLVAENPNTHQRMGVGENQGTVISFYLGDFLQESFVLGTWSEDSRLCYLQRSGKDEVHAVECPVEAASIFPTNPDGWRNPVVLSVPRDEVVSVTFTYPDDEFELKISAEGRWVVADASGEVPANLVQVDTVLSILELLIASGFATEDEAEALSFDVSDASLRVVTTEESSVPTTRLRFLAKDSETVYLSSPAQATTFIMDGRLVGALLQSRAQLQVIR